MKEMPALLRWYPPTIPKAERPVGLLEKKYRIFPVAKHVEPKGGRHDGLAPMVCCTLLVPPRGQMQTFVLRGADRSTLTMLAQGIDHAVRGIVGQLGRVPVICVTKSRGIWNHVGTVRESYSRGRLCIDGLPVFMALAGLDEMVKIGKRRPESQLEERFERLAEVEATKQRMEVLADFRADPKAFEEPGVKWIGYKLVSAPKDSGSRD